MSWQNSINAPVNAQGEYAAKRFYGDPRLSAEYLPVAYALLGGLKNQMALSGVGFGHRRIQLPDGTMIRVIRNGEQNILEIDTQAHQQSVFVGLLAIYMESGFVLMKQTGFPDQFQAKSELLETDSTERADKFKDSMILSRIDRQSLFNDRSHAVPGGYLDKRHTFPISLLVTGKLRSLLQAKLGRADPTYQVPEEGEDNEGAQSTVNQLTMEDMWKFIAGTHTYKGLEYIKRVIHNTHGKNQSYGLFCGDDYQYYFIEIYSHTSIDELMARGYPCVLGAAGQAIREILIAVRDNKSDYQLTEEEVRRLETYLLSDITVDLATYFVIGYFSVYGYPVFNGWHFNSTGSEADIVTLSLVPDESLSLRYKHTLSRHYRLSFSMAPVGSEVPLTVNCSLLESEPMTPWMGRDNLWIPALMDGKMTYYYWRGISTFTEELEFDGPIYGFYNHEDEFVMMRLLYRNEEADDVSRVCDVAYAAAFGKAGGDKVEVTRIASDRTFTHGFYSTINGVTGKEYFVPDKIGSKGVCSSVSVPTGNRFTEKLTNKPVTTKISPIYNIEVVPPDSLSSIFTSTIHEHQITGENYCATNWNIANIAIAIIPWHDAESFYLGNVITESDSGTKTTTRQWVIGEENITVHAPAARSFTVYLQTRPNATGTQGAGLVHPPQIPAEYEIINYNRFICGLDLHYRHGSLSVATLDYADDTHEGAIWGEIEAISGWYRLMAPILFGPGAYPFFNYSYQVVQGILDNIIYYTDPHIENYDEGYVYRGIKPPKPEFSGYLRLGSFSGWT